LFSPTKELGYVKNKKRIKPNKQRFQQFFPRLGLIGTGKRAEKL